MKCLILQHCRHMLAQQDMETNDIMIQRSAQIVVAAALGIPLRANLDQELAIVEKAESRGWFTPDEDEIVRTRYSNYLSSRAALIGALQQLETSLRSSAHWQDKLPYFITGFAAACLMIRGSSFIIELAKKRPVIWKKLDEAEQRFGLPRKTFTYLHQAATNRHRLLQFREAVQFYRDHRIEIMSYADDSSMAPIIAILREEEVFLENHYQKIWKRRLFYRWYSFLRRHRSGYRNVMFQLFRWSGSAIAELHQPGVKQSGEPKRINQEQRQQLLALAQPGDVFITRHDDAMSNLFLPGFWPHAALHLGEISALKNLLENLPPAVRVRLKSNYHFLEAKKDGVLFRAAEETLAVDACLILRPPFAKEILAQALLRAFTHEGKLYDFLFDFRTADRLACTEVIYRTYHGCAGMEFSLLQKAGRACIPAENLIDQMMAAGFQLIASCNVRDQTIHTQQAALDDLIISREKQKNM
jgi:Permuted papain-like amidase enzyme, YaeF/YiiX, C92 family